MSTDIPDRLAALLATIVQVLMEVSDPHGGGTISRTTEEAYQRAWQDLHALGFDHANLEDMGHALAGTVQQLSSWEPTEGRGKSRGKLLKDGRRFLRRIAIDYLPATDSEICYRFSSLALLTFEGAAERRKPVLKELSVEPDKRSEDFQRAWLVLAPVCRHTIEFIVYIHHLKKGAGLFG